MMYRNLPIWPLCKKVSSFKAILTSLATLSRVNGIRADNFLWLSSFAYFHFSSFSRPAILKNSVKMFKPRGDYERPSLNQLNTVNLIYIVVLFWWHYKMRCVSWNRVFCVIVYNRNWNCHEPVSVINWFCVRRILAFFKKIWNFDFFLSGKKVRN